MRNDQKYLGQPHIYVCMLYVCIYYTPLTKSTNSILPDHINVTNPAHLLQLNKSTLLSCATYDMKISSNLIGGMLVTLTMVTFKLNLCQFQRCPSFATLADVGLIQTMTLMTLKLASYCELGFNNHTFKFLGCE